MKRIYLWAMRNGAPVLFALSFVLFLIGFGQMLASVNTSMGQTFVNGQPVTEGAMNWLLLLTGTFSALSAAVLPFAVALAIYRWDSLARDPSMRNSGQKSA